MNLRRCESPGDSARIAALSADQAPTAIIGCPDMTPEAWKQLRMLSLNLGSSTQSLGEDAINLLFEKHRLNRIA
jgi:hypothetical protein